MTRKDFLKNIGVGAAFVLTVPCLHSCKDDDDNPSGENHSAGDQNFTVDLDASQNVALMTTGGFIIKNKVVVARTVDDQYVAASQVCSHEGTEVMQYDATADEWFCSTHGESFALTTGVPQNDVTDKNLRLYTVTRVDNILTVEG